MTKKLHPWWLALFLVLSSTAAGRAGETRIYAEKTGDASTSFVWQLEEGDETVVTSRETGALFVNRLNADGGTRLWRHETDRRRITVQRRGDRLELNGVEDGRPVRAQWPIDELPWYQPLSYSLRGFLQSNRDSVRFWMVRSDALKPIRMKAVKAGNDSIDLNGTPVDAVKVRLEPDGLLSVLWHAHYWYRRSDGLFLRFEGRSGPPGAPVSVVQLQSPIERGDAS